MTSPNLLKLAKLGDAQAIAAMINRSLRDKHIIAKVNRKEDCLQVLLESAQVPSQKTMIPFIRQGLTKLGVETITTVQVYGRQAGQKSPAWNQSFELESSPTQATDVTAENHTSSEVESPVSEPPPGSHFTQVPRHTTTGGYKSSKNRQTSAYTPHRNTQESHSKPRQPMSGGDAAYAGVHLSRNHFQFKWGKIFLSRTTLIITALALLGLTVILSPIKLPPLSFSVQFTQTSNNSAFEVQKLLEQGSRQLEASQYKEAIESFQKSLSISQEIGDRRGEANSLYNLGVVYDNLYQYENAIDFYQQALSIYQEIGDKEDIADSLINLGSDYDKLYQYEKAINFYQQSLSVYQDIGERKGQANSLLNLGETYDDLSQYEKAINFYQQSLPIFQKIGDRQGEANSLMNLGFAYRNLSDYKKAIDFFQRSLPIFKEISDRRGIASSLLNLGVVYDDMSQYEKAIDFYQQSLLIFQEIGDHKGEAITLNNLGFAYGNLSDYEKAIDFFQQSLLISQQISDKRGEARTLQNLGLVYRALEQEQKAKEFFEKSQRIQQEIGID